MSDPTPAPETGVAGETRSSWQDLPLQEQTRAWEAAVPGSAERILRQIEADYEHRRWMDRVEVRFRIFGAVLAASGITGVFWLATYLVDHGAPAYAVGVFGASIASFAGLVLSRMRKGP